MVGELFAEDVDQHMAFPPEVGTPTREITIDDIQVGDPGVPKTDGQEKLRQVIWRSRYLLIREQFVIYMWVGPTRLRRGSGLWLPNFENDKFADLIKGLMSAKIIRPSTHHERHL